jgi:hypothetical protein
MGDMKQLFYYTHFLLPSITINYIPQTTQNSAFFLTAAHASILEDPARQSAYRKRLYPRPTGTTQRCKK